MESPADSDEGHVLSEILRPHVCSPQSGREIEIRFSMLSSIHKLFWDAGGLFDTTPSSGGLDAERARNPSAHEPDAGLWAALAPWEMKDSFDLVTPDFVYQRWLTWRRCS